MRIKWKEKELEHRDNRDEIRYPERERERLIKYLTWAGRVNIDGHMQSVKISERLSRMRREMARYLRMGTRPRPSLSCVLVCFVIPVLLVL